MAILKNTNTLQDDKGGGSKKATAQNGSVYGSGSYYGGAAAGKTGSQLGLYGSNYGGASTTSKVVKPSAYSAPSTKYSNPDDSPSFATYMYRDNSTKNTDTPSGGYKYSGTTDTAVSGGSGGGGSSGGGTSSGTLDSFWEQYYAAAKAYADEQLNNNLRDNTNSIERQLNRSNVQYLNDDSRIRKLYGEGPTGGGYSNMWANKRAYRNRNADIISTGETNANNLRNSYSNYMQNLNLQRYNNKFNEWAAMLPYYMNNNV